MPRRRIYHDPRLKAGLVKEALIRAVDADRITEIANDHCVPSEELENWISKFLDNFDDYFSDKLLIDKLIFRPLQNYSEEATNENLISQLIDELSGLRRHHREILRERQFDYSEATFHRNSRNNVERNKEFLIGEFLRRTVRKYLGIYVCYPVAPYFEARTAVLEDFFPTSELVFFGDRDSLIMWLSKDLAKMKFWLESTLQEMNESLSIDFVIMKDLIYFLYQNKAEDILGKPFEDYLKPETEFGKVLCQMRTHYAEKMARRERHRLRM